MATGGVVRQTIVRLFSRPLAAWEYRFKPELRDPFGGPFNGQKGRQASFLEVARLLDATGVVETGTFRGSTTEFMAERTNLPVWTVEARLRFYHFARIRLAQLPNVRISLNDSRTFLNRLAVDPSIPKRRVFFYLDAHWYEDLPLREEVATITKYWTDIAIMVDDFKVPGDPHYQFDDYGDGRTLSLDYLGPLAQRGLTAFFPTLPATDETGMRRGSVVLADGPAVSRLASAKTLTRA